MSAILSVDDLNDFISPGVACIKPVETLPAADAHDETEVMLDGGSQQQQQQSAAQISLTDCLACSGCVTSAEAVLVSLQSHAEVLATLDAAPALRVVAVPAATADNDDPARRFVVEGLADPGARLLVASVSPQTRASLAAACPSGAVSGADVRRMVDVLLRGDSGLAAGGACGSRFSWVVDTDVVRDATLVLAADEALGASTPSRPVLAASCPGWVCYAEKTHPHVLPHLSRVKSPQALAGTLLKTTLSRSLGIPPSRIWHLAVMPCFDKKLEASREELTDQAWAGADSLAPGVRDVDCVITSKELLMLCESRGIDFFQLPRDGTSIPPLEPFPDSRLHQFLFPTQRPRSPPRVAGSSGGLLHYILQSRAAQTPGSEIRTTRGRNADVVEYCVSLDGQPLFRAARYYGFRNIQNLVRRLKPARPSRMPGGKPFGSARRAAGKSAASLEYGYVEVMACPGGCTNGGGQIKVEDPIVAQRKGFVGKPGPQEQKDWLAEVDEAYFSDGEAETEDGPIGGDVVDGISSSHVHDTLVYWSEMTGIGLDRLAFTSYREVISDVGKDRATDADKVVQLAGKVGGGW
ncbi:cytosolic Fe-S cluster assembly factor nar1 [Hirsutella rhossiliensis]|uniref:Cytosolic Fe-S cluster assembly factor NAR1 n=1 Tax=Hirsutella rhossiliensis TaxID=111463 RepID=A0A9P8MY13_9HYPO|nr:cytosolic Fe-S cluster assembly factor nar1 [Hirsutella rhossiliensis]KAH0963422.1 cytosolic Fe-S cluster assembly factor nar1 [Hirsutella rhossiliensis]